MDWKTIMPTQLTFFDAPISRPSDPATSQFAATELQGRLGTLQTRLLEAVASLSQPTANEAAQAAVELHGGMAESYRKRMKELVRQGLVVVAGERQCWITRKMAQTYKLHSSETLSPWLKDKAASS
jgi:hypothetical protein